MLLVLYQGLYEYLDPGISSSLCPSLTPMLPQLFSIVPNVNTLNTSTNMLVALGQRIRPRRDVLVPEPTLYKNFRQK